jgi:hypothetical protein
MTNAHPLNSSAVERLRDEIVGAVVTNAVGGTDDFPALHLVSFIGDLDEILSHPQGEAELVQCCMCGKKGLSTVEGDGGSECQLEDGRWTCSFGCYNRATADIPLDIIAKVYSAHDHFALLEGVDNDDLCAVLDAGAALASPVAPAGYRVVPVELTQPMSDILVLAGQPRTIVTTQDVWDALLGAAASPPPAVPVRAEERESVLTTLREKHAHYLEKVREYKDSPGLVERFNGLAVATHDAIKLIEAQVTR